MGRVVAGKQLNLEQARKQQARGWAASGRDCRVEGDRWENRRGAERLSLQKAGLKALGRSVAEAQPAPHFSCEGKK